MGEGDEGQTKSITGIYKGWLYAEVPHHLILLLLIYLYIFHCIRQGEKSAREGRREAQCNFHAQRDRPAVPRLGISQAGFLLLLLHINNALLYFRFCLCFRISPLFAGRPFFTHFVCRGSLLLLLLLLLLSCALLLLVNVGSRLISAPFVTAATCCCPSPFLAPLQPHCLLLFSPIFHGHHLLLLLRLFCIILRPFRNIDEINDTVYILLFSNGRFILLFFFFFLTPRLALNKAI